MNKTFLIKIIQILFLILSFTSAYALQEKHKTARKLPDADERVVASIGKLQITADEFKRGYEFGPAFYKREKKSKDIYLNYLINEKLLALDGYKRGVDTIKQVADMFRAFHDDLITDELFKDEISNKIKVTNDEIDSVVTQKNLEIDIKWLYTPSKDEALNYLASLNKGASFDSLFKSQAKDSILINDRQLKTDFYNLKLKNPLMAKIIDTLKAGKVSLPILAKDGWYLVELENISRNLILTESEMAKLRSESIEAVKMKKMDYLSEKYVVNLMSKAKPVIRKTEFNILLSYIGNYILPKDKYEKWKLSERMDSALSYLKIKDREKISKLVLVDMKNGSVTLSDLLNWYWTRDQYIKLNEKDLDAYLFSLKQMTWRMVRDNILVTEANKKNIAVRQSVKKWEKWWKDKIVYSYVRNELSNAVLLENKEVLEQKIDSKENSRAEKLNTELSKKIFRKVIQLKKETPVKIYTDVLKSVTVTDGNDLKAIELYTVKRGGLIPRTPFPTIDNDWKSWE